MVDIVEYFDPYNMDHIRAFKYLMDNYRWPDLFWTEMMGKNIIISPSWQVRLASKMADEWVKHALKRYGGEPDVKNK